MEDIAKQIGFSRVNLSNSLNNNPTLSLLTEVVKILGIKVSELFRQVTNEKKISEYLKYDSSIVKIDSNDDMQQFIV